MRALLEVAQVRVATCNASRRARQQVVDELRGELQQVVGSADRLKVAVAAVASNLAPSEGTCPVCLWPHGAIELQRRLQEALSTISPLVAGIQSRLAEAEAHLQAASDAVRDAEVGCAKATEDVSRIVAESEALDNVIQTARGTPLLAAVEHDAASHAIEVRLATIGRETVTLHDEQGTAPREDEVRAAYAGANAEYAVAREALTSARIALDDAEARRAQAQSRLEELATMQDLAESPDEGESSRNVTVAEQAVAAARANQETQARALADAEAILARAEQEVNRQQTAVAVIAGRLRDAISSWRKVTLEGVPAAAGLERARLEASASSAAASAARARVDVIAVEVARWATAERFQGIDAEISRQLTAGEDEATRGERLSAKEKDASRAYDDASDVRAAMEKLAEALKTRIETFHAAVIEPVIPTQQALLRRMVRERRFEKATVAFQQRYNKQLAEIEVPLNGIPTPVGLVASEAQATEVQLSFLLALALSHRWCGWRALLLDDPTQHHDLIHASAVFDVLRDFVADHGFQLLLATHDAGQARFWSANSETMDFRPVYTS